MGFSGLEHMYGGLGAYVSQYLALDIRARTCTVEARTGPVFARLDRFLISR